jgi:protein tyrosine/serine phosphatase
MKRLLALALATCACSSTTYYRDIPNMVQVDACVWRSGQPLKREQWETIRGLGIDHIAKLNFESEGSDDGARELGIDVQSFGIEPRADLDFFDKIAHTFKHPNEKVVAAVDAYISRFAPVVPGHGQTACPNGMLLVHCTHGQDRTGFAIGRYQVLVHHMSKEAAYTEMRAHHFHTSLHGIADAWEDWQPSERTATPRPDPSKR